ncbi:hypothetical protein J2T22_001601 [Pseudarthrobacter defluvii]|uniref:ABC transporter ATP-binding protein n=1 Tax=Pseudarthrobacter defluvii TaxID=410837 RepID=A0ABT9UFJ8_9MICC|nr:hypothetical protein [Pseudarthrobacter defluvii]
MTLGHAAEPLVHIQDFRTDFQVSSAASMCIRVD